MAFIYRSVSSRFETKSEFRLVKTPTDNKIMVMASIYRSVSSPTETKLEFRLVQTPTDNKFMMMAPKISFTPS